MSVDSDLDTAALDATVSTLRESYRQGRTTYLDVFDARRQYVEARARELDQLAELNTQKAKVEAKSNTINFDLTD